MAVPLLSGYMAPSLIPLPSLGDPGKIKQPASADTRRASQTDEIQSKLQTLRTAPAKEQAHQLPKQREDGLGTATAYATDVGVMEVPISGHHVHLKQTPDDEPAPVSRELEEQEAGGNRLPSSNATPYTLFRKVPVSDNHADLKRTQDDGPAPDLAVAHPGTETGDYMLPPFNATPAYPFPLPGSQGPAETHARQETDGYMSPSLKATPANLFPVPTSSVPLWNHARKILGQPSYFHQTMLKHYPWEEKVPSFAAQRQAAGRGAGEGEQREDDNDNGDETMDEDDDDDRCEEEKDQEQEPFLSRHHDCVLHVEQFLSDFSVQLTACKYWEDEDALHQLQDLLTIARKQVCMLEQPRPADGDV